MQRCDAQLSSQTGPGDRGGREYQANAPLTMVDTTESEARFYLPTITNMVDGGHSGSAGRGPLSPEDQLFVLQPPRDLERPRPRRRPLLLAQDAREQEQRHRP